MYEQERRRVRPVSLPSALDENTRARLDLNKARLENSALAAERLVARQSSRRDDCLCVAAAEEFVRHEGLRAEGARDFDEARREHLRRDVRRGALRNHARQIPLVA